MKDRKKCDSPKEILKNEMTRLIFPNCVDRCVPTDIPNKWEKHGDLVLLSASCFQDPIWLNLGMTIS